MAGGHEGATGALCREWPGRSAYEQGTCDCSGGKPVHTGSFSPGLCVLSRYLCLSLRVSPVYLCSPVFGVPNCLSPMSQTESQKHTQAPLALLVTCYPLPRARAGGAQGAQGWEHGVKCHACHPDP